MSNKLDKNGLAQMINEHVAVSNRIEETQNKLAEVDALLERFEAGEEISEQELNELLGGLSALGRWGRDKAGSAVGKIGAAAKQFGQDVQQQYQKGQRAAALNKQRKKVDQLQQANNEKVQDLAAKGKAINDRIKQYQRELMQIGAEYEKLTGKEYIPGRAVANAKRYVSEYDREH